MAISKTHKLTREDLFLSLGAIALPIHIWAIIHILQVFPAWLLRSSLWDLVGVISYPLVGALLESCIVWAGFILFGFILPKRWLADKFVALSSILAWVLAAWAVVVQFNFQHFLRWDRVGIGLGLLFIAFTLWIVSWLVRRFRRIEDLIKKIAQGIEVLGYFYIAFDLLGLAVILLRNL